MSKNNFKVLCPRVQYMVVNTWTVSHCSSFHGDRSVQLMLHYARHHIFKGLHITSQKKSTRKGQQQNKQKVL